MCIVALFILERPRTWTVRIGMPGDYTERRKFGLEMLRGSW